MTTIVDATEPESVRYNVTGLDPVLDGDHCDNQEWCTLCAGSDDPEDPGMPQLIVRERRDDWGVRGEAELSCGHIVALGYSVSSGQSAHSARKAATRGPHGHELWKLRPVSVREAVEGSG